MKISSSEGKRFVAEVVPADPDQHLSGVRPRHGKHRVRPRDIRELRLRIAGDVVGNPAGVTAEAPNQLGRPKV